MNACREVVGLWHFPKCHIRGGPSYARERRNRSHSRSSLREDSDNTRKTTGRADFGSAPAVTQSQTTTAVSPSPRCQLRFRASRKTS